VNTRAPDRAVGRYFVSSFHHISMPTPRGASPVKGQTTTVSEPPQSKERHVPGLPITQGNDYDFFQDVQMGTAKGFTGLPDIHMNTARFDTLGADDIRMETARGATAKVNRFKMWELELLESPEVRRKGTVAQLCECACIHAPRHWLSPACRLS
jgi:hypothetical protein